MNTLLILDKDLKTKLSEDLKVKVVRTLEEKGHQLEPFELFELPITTFVL